MIFDAGSVTFRNEIYDKYKANRPEPPEDLIPQFPLIREAARAFNVPGVRAGGLRGRRPDRDLRPPWRVEAGGTCTIVSSDKDLMQLVATGRRACWTRSRTSKLGPEAVLEKFGVDAGQGGRRAGAGRRFDRQRAGRAGHRHQDRGPADQRVWRPRNAAGARRRDQAAQAPRIAAEQCRAGAHLQAAGARCATTCRRRPLPDAFDKRRPDPNVLLPWLEQQGFRTPAAARSRASWARRPRRSRRRSAPAPVDEGRAARADARAAAALDEAATGDFTAADYELIQDETLLDDWIAEATQAGTVAFDTETDGARFRQCRPGRRLAGPARGPWGDVNSTRRRAPTCR